MLWPVCLRECQEKVNAMFRPVAVNDAPRSTSQKLVFVERANKPHLPASHMQAIVQLTERSNIRIDPLYKIKSSTHRYSSGQEKCAEAVPQNQC